jgi:hypothetical protein
MLAGLSVAARRSTIHVEREIVPGPVRAAHGESARSLSAQTSWRLLAMIAGSL